MTDLTVRPLDPSDRDRWADLYRGYREFYEHPSDEAVVERVWGWVTDATHEVSAFVAVGEGRVVGIAHYRRFARPSSGTIGMFLDDLFTDPDARGRGVGRALIERVAELAASENCSVVRWLTSETNAQARVLYDQVASITPVITYDITPQLDT